MKQQLIMYHVIPDLMARFELDLGLAQSVDYKLTSGSGVSWHNAVANPLVIENLSAGTYSVEVPSLSNGCNFNIFEISVSEPSPLASVGTVISEVNGADGSIELEIIGGTPPYMYAWNTGDESALIENLKSGLYTVDITDANGCMLEQKFNLGSVMKTDESLISSEVLWYYDPITGVHTIQNFNQDGPVEFILFDISGRQIQNIMVQFNDGTGVFNVSTTLSKGAYIIAHPESGLSKKMVY